MNEGGALFDRIVVFASGRGTGFERLLRDRAEGRLGVTIAALVCNEPGAGAIAIAEEHSVPVALAPHKGLSREAHEERVLGSLKAAASIDLRDDGGVVAVLAGYMRLFSAAFVESLRFPDRGVSRMVNIHPSLLPSYKGVDGYGQAHAHGAKVTGATVHFVTTGLDDGPIIAQAALAVGEGEGLESLRARGHALEHELYGATIQRLARVPWGIEGRRVIFHGK